MHQPSGLAKGLVQLLSQPQHQYLSSELQNEAREANSQCPCSEEVSPARAWLAALCHIALSGFVEPCLFADAEPEDLALPAGALMRRQCRLSRPYCLCWLPCN